MKGIFWLLLLTLTGGVAIYWLGFSDDGKLRQDAETESSMVQDQSPPPAQDAPNSETLSVEPEPGVAPGPSLIVDSFAPSEQTSLDSWTQSNEPSGHVDMFQRSRDGAGVEESLLIEPNDVLVARGWAGNFALGLQFKDVVLSACGQIIARGQVGAARPDVAKVIHPNLVPSGWTAQVLGGDLPFCADSQLRGWAVAPGARAILAPLAGKFAYVPPAKVDIPNRLSAQKAITPDVYPKPQFVAIKVKASKANLRKCGSVSCEVVGQVARGEYVAHIATRRAEWSLVFMSESNGWLFNDLFEIAP